MISEKSNDMGESKMDTLGGVELRLRLLDDCRPNAAYIEFEAHTLIPPVMLQEANVESIAKVLLRSLLHAAEDWSMKQLQL